MKEWFIKNGAKGHYFVVGWCSFACIDALARGEYVFAIINGLLVYLNVQMSKQWD